MGLQVGGVFPVPQPTAPTEMPMSNEATDQGSALRNPACIHFSSTCPSTHGAEPCSATPLSNVEFLAARNVETANLPAPCFIDKEREACSRGCNKVEASGLAHLSFPAFKLTAGPNLQTPVHPLASPLITHNPKLSFHFSRTSGNANPSSSSFQ